MSTNIFQLTCPNCKHEFHYNRDYHDKNIKQLGKEIADIQRQFKEYNSLPVQEKVKRKQWRVNAHRAIEVKKLQIAELREYKHIAEKTRKADEFQLFKEAVKEICGMELYQKCFEAVDEYEKAYNISDTSKVGYTRRKGQSVISVNKI